MSVDINNDDALVVSISSDNDDDDDDNDDDDDATCCIRPILGVTPPLVRSLHSSIEFAPP